MGAASRQPSLPEKWIVFVSSTDDWIVRMDGGLQQISIQTRHTQYSPWRVLSCLRLWP